MHKLIILGLTIGGFIFAGPWNNDTVPVKKSDPLKNQFCLAEDTGSDDYKLERRRRGSRGDKKRRRGGSGLR